MQFLQGRSLELGLKCLLRKSGVSMEVLVKHIGHDLLLAARYCRVRGLWPADPYQRAIIRGLNGYYRAKLLEYRRIGGYAFGSPLALRMVLADVLLAAAAATWEKTPEQITRLAQVAYGILPPDSIEYRHDSAE